VTLFNEEVETLARRWGQPRLVEKQIAVAPGLKAETVRDFFSDRWGEVVMVIRRAMDGRVWVMTKASFPKGLYSLPTGGIRHHETISEALRRELAEETGFEAQVQQFLAVIRYVPIPAPGDPPNVPAFVSFAFLLEEGNGKDPVVSCGEKILDFKAITPTELETLAQQWRELSGSSDEFHDLTAWGEFRGLTHQVVSEALSSGGE
jgi:8-oxo-dGTP diphosphatase